MKNTALVLLVMLTSCYAEWDVPKVQRRDACTGVVQDAYVYVMPTCRNPPMKHPRDLQE